MNAPESKLDPKLAPKPDLKPDLQLDSQLEYPFGDHLPAPGTTFEVAPGVLWLRMGLPFALDHINLWLLEDEIETVNGRVHGWTAIDCGIATDATRASWETIFASQLRGLPILRVLVTHCHPDHPRHDRRDEHDQGPRQGHAGASAAPCGPARGTLCHVLLVAAAVGGGVAARVPRDAVATQ